jgi:hypothetical protein
MSKRSARLRHPGTVGGSSGPRMSRPRRETFLPVERRPRGELRESLTRRW